MPIRSTTDPTRTHGPASERERDTAADPRRAYAAPTADAAFTTRSPAARPSAPTGVLSRLRSALRGDKYMVGAYPPDWPLVSDVRGDGARGRET